MASKPAPSAGMKVTRGGEAPITQESAGLVPESSLAAESTRAGGGFASNPGQHGQSDPQSQPQSQQQPHQQSAEQHQHQSKPARQQGYVIGTGQSLKSHGGGGGTDANKTTSLNLENRQAERGGHAQSHGLGGVEGGQGGDAPSYAHGSHYDREMGGGGVGRPHGKNLHEGGFEGSGTAEGALPEPGSMDDPGRLAERAMMGGMRSHGGPRETGIRDERRYEALGNDEPA
ncbi:hypothetical protein MFIFM68171_06445 [Madurella fahalii]|uniref:Uncharacterized protein n=1 Tax=Madurella fahalii TaxID=1157608 RepID=A0ABQ0GEN5_9PEZI